MTDAVDARVMLCLGGDVMTGRGIDQLLPDPAQPELREPNMPSARDYVERAWRQSGKPVGDIDADYPWGDLPRVLDTLAPGLRIANLETAITARGAPWPDKRYHFRMSPANARCLKAMRFDAFSLANNHVLDWGHPGLDDTLATLDALGIAHAGAGPDRDSAIRPATLPLPGGGRLLLFGCGMRSSGIPDRWAAGARRAGVNLLDACPTKAASTLARRIGALRQPGDLVVCSIHWGANWDFEVSAAQRAFARRLVDTAGVDVVHGHSSHHVKGVEVHRGKLILYGCGELINDYERIAAYAAYRNELSLLWLPELDRATGALVSLRMLPTRIRRLQVGVADAQDTQALSELLSRQCEPLGTAVVVRSDGCLELRWQ